MEYIFGFLVFFFGAALGSFITVIADRHNTGLSFLRGRSFCFSCNAVLRQIELVPLFSYIFLRGRCRHCQSKIPKASFLIEVAMGVLSLLAAFKSGFFGFDFLLVHNAYFLIGNLPMYLLTTLIFANLLLIAVYDLRHFIIPDSFLISFFLIALSSKLQAFSLSDAGFDIITGIGLSLPFLTIFLISGGTWLGFGDVKFIGVLGFFLGLASGLSAIILAFWIGAVFSLSALLVNKMRINLPMLSNNLTIKSEVPFGPFLSLGILISFYFNADIFQIHSLLNIF